MSERDNESFDIDGDFLADAEESNDFDGMLDKAERRVRPQPGVKKGKAAWSRLEEVLAERRLERQLREVFDDEG
ncbi:MAG: hypothetical protein R3E72_11495 [Steroidobacteraceae bacterium]